jgi:hypothetical protein
MNFSCNVNLLARAHMIVLRLVQLIDAAKKTIAIDAGFLLSIEDQLEGNTH